MTQAELKSLFKYDPETGIFIRKYKVRGQKPNSPVGNKDSFGHLRTRVGTREHGVNYRLHHLAWLYVYGYMPNMIDHKNQIPHDNRIENLRECTTKENGMNRSLNTNNTTGVCGVTKTKHNTFNAYIKVNGKGINLGTFKTIEEASAARQIANEKYGFYVNHGNKKQKEI